MQQPYQTSAYGFCINVNDKDFKMTKAAFVRLCRTLEAKFGQGNIFMPHAKKGLVWSEWPERDPTSYAVKSIVFSPFDDSTSGFSWPRHVDADSNSAWVGDQTVIFGKGRYSTYLSALAVPWTIAELTSIKEVLEDSFDFHVYDMPQSDALLLTID